MRSGERPSCFVRVVPSSARRRAAVALTLRRRYVGTQPVLALVQAHASAAGASVGVLGCGLSALPAALAAAGYARVCAVDASEVAIQARFPARLTPPRRPALRRGMLSAWAVVHHSMAVLMK